MKKSVFGLAVGLAVGLMTAAPASAATITFDPTGTPGASGDISNIALWDPAPGNALAVGASASLDPAGPNPNFTLLYQANMGAFQAQNTAALFSNGTGNNFFTIVLGFQETLTGNTTVGGTNTALTFGFSPLNNNSISTDPNDPNFFFMYKVGDFGDNLSGTGFIPGAPGTSPNPILSGHVVNSADYSSNFVANGNTGPLDQTLGDTLPHNDYAGFNTVLGSGSTVLRIVIDSFNADYFPGFVGGTEIVFAANTSQNLGFTTVDPSACFSNNGLTSCNQAGATQASILGGSLSGLNGLSGPNTILLADANGAFDFTPAAVPEPATMTLLGLGLAAAARRLRKKGSKATPVV